jgi:hypothetical protein
MCGALTDEGHFRPVCIAGKLDQFETIGDGTDRTDEIMTDPGRCQSRDIMIMVGHDHDSKRHVEMTDFNSLLEPGMLVKHPEQPDWGVGQVQSNIGGRITVNFREVGKMVIDGNRIGLVMVIED